VAADVTQQAFLIAAERLDDIAQGSERAFLMATALRLAISRRAASAGWSWPRTWTSTRRAGAID